MTLSPLASRRAVLKGAAATSLFLAAPITLRAQPTIVRKSLATSDSDSDVETYRDAVKFMLTKAEPDDPQLFHLNWYRNAMIHLLDCPHGNWWFSVWHRPYLALLEQKIREISRNDEFALPFWDWTVQPEIPKAFLSDPSSSDADLKDNPLDPSSSYYVNASHKQPLNDALDAALADYFGAIRALTAAQTSGNQTAIAQAEANVDIAIQVYNAANDALLDHTFPQFDVKFRAAFEDIWTNFTPEQLAQLTTRFGVADGQSAIDFEWFWSGSGNSVRGNFGWDIETARFLKTGASGLTGNALAAVADNNIISSIRSPNFALRTDQVGGENPAFGFNTIDGDTHHSMSRTQSILEGQPHNLVHNATGTVMQSNLSSIDPIFFMHHSNVDRVWDIWTRRQQGLTPPRPHLPEHDVTKYDDEEFLFYIQPSGASLTQDTNAGSFMDKSRFGYSYAAGTGEDQVATSLVFANVATKRVDTGADLIALSDPGFSPTASVPLNDQISSVFGPPVTAPNVLAELTMTLPDSLLGLTIEVYVSLKGEIPDTSADSNARAGAIGFFGMNALSQAIHHDHENNLASDTAVFDVDITDAIKRLTDGGASSVGHEINVSIHPVRIFGNLRSDAGTEAVLQSVRLKTI